MNHHILRSSPATLELQVYNNGTLTDLDANPTLVVTDANGTTVSSGAVTKPGAPNNVGVYRSVLPGQANLSLLGAAWTGLLAGAAVTFHQSYEVVGNLLFTEAEARSEPIVGQQPALADDTKYSDTLIANWRAVIGELFEDRLHQGVIRRYCRTRFHGEGGQVLDLAKGRPVTSTGSVLRRPGRRWDIAQIISATINGDPVADLDDLIIDGHWLYHTTGSWPRASLTTPLNITVEYEYGPDPVSWEARQAGLDLLLANAAPKGFPSTATSLSNEDGTFRIATFPLDVEEFLTAHKHRMPGFA